MNAGNFVLDWAVGTSRLSHICYLVGGDSPAAGGVTLPQLERFQPRGVERGVFAGA
jgi:hypothetical protein